MRRVAQSDPIGRDADGAIWSMVATYQRPQRLLLALQSLVDHGARHILVVDNDPVEQAGKAAALAYFDSLDSPGIAIHAIIATTPGVSAVRNVGLSHLFDTKNAKAVFILDDDSLVDGSFAKALGALGRPGDVQFFTPQVVYELPQGTRPELRELDVFKHMAQVEMSDRIRTANGLAITRLGWEAFATDGVLFDQAFGVSGGEDTELGYRVKKAGGIVGKWPDVVVTEPVPTARATLSWVLQRQRVSAANEVRVWRKHSGTVRAVFRAVRRAAKGTASALFHAFRLRFALSLLRLAGAWGSLEGVVSFQHRHAHDADVSQNTGSS